MTDPRITRVPAAARSAALAVLVLVMGCTPSSTSSSPPGSEPPSAAASPTESMGGDLVIVGRIVTMDEPATAEAFLIEDGQVTAVGTRDEVEALADDSVPVIDIGSNVAYPGFIDAHAHWIGDRNHYGLGTPAEAMEAAAARGWTSISEQWVNPERLDELETLAADGALPLRVDAYLALNAPEPDTHYGDWYTDREPGPVGDRLRVRGLKIHLDDGRGAVLLWESADLTETIGRANEAGWQVSVHTVSTEAADMVLDAFEASIGRTGPNPLHHRIDHAIQVSDEQLARMVDMDLATVIHLDGVPIDWVLWSEYLGHGSPENLAGGTAWLTRWRDFVDAGLHVASATDMPWFVPEFVLTDDIGRPVDQIAGGMDSLGRSFPETPAWMRDQLLTAEQGLKAVTIDAAWALGDEANRGHLAVGSYGDVTILSRDVTIGTPDEIRSTEVIATIVDGITIYCASLAYCRS